MLKPRIVRISEKKCVGISMQMSIIENKTGQLWGSFMPRKQEILNSVSKDLLSLQIYPKGYFDAFNPQSRFTKWALVEVEAHNLIPKGMESFILQGGTYAVFDYKGSPNDNSIFQNIYSSWLPNSDYVLSDRPHFEVLGEKYKRYGSESEEEIWIPIQ